MGFNEDDSNVSAKLVFKALLEEHRHLDGREINLLLGEVTSRGDRKAYSNNKGLSEIKDFFINHLKLSSTNCSNNAYFAIFKTKGNFYLYFVPNLESTSSADKVILFPLITLTKLLNQKIQIFSYPKECFLFPIRPH